MENTKNLENEKVIKCPQCRADSTPTGGKTPDGRLLMYRCDNEACHALFTVQDWLTCPSCMQQGELLNEVDDGFEVCICKNPKCTVLRFPGRKIEEVQVSYTTRLTGDEVWDVCPTCGKVGRNTGEVNSGGRIVFACENEECPEKVYAGRTQEEITAAVEEPFDWRKRLDELKEIMQGCINAAVEIHPDGVDAEKPLAEVEYIALCRMRSDCALALFRVLTTDTARVVDIMDKAAAAFAETDKNRRNVDIMILPKGLIPPMPPTGEQC